MRLNERMAIVETEIKFMKKLLYLILTGTFGSVGFQIIGAT